MFHATISAIQSNASSMKQRKTKWAAVLLALLPGGVFELGIPKSAVAEPGELTIPYSPRGSVGLGDGLDIDFPAQAKAPCISYEDSGVKWDSAGAIETKYQLQLVSSSEQIKVTENINLAYEAKVNASAGLFSADGETTFTGRYSLFRSQESKSLALVLTAQATYGRRLIGKYDLANQYKEIIKGNPNGFRRLCGTHFARGEVRRSSVSVVITITNLSESSKRTLETTFTQAMGGKGSIESISFGGNTKLTASIGRIIELAKTFGSVSVDFYARGGQGISTAAAAAKASDPSDIAKLADIIESVSKSFTQDNSAPTEYLLVPFTVFGAPEMKFDQARYEILGSLYAKLVRVEGSVETMKVYETKLPAMFHAHFAGQLVKLQGLRLALITAIDRCAKEYACEDKFMYPKDIYFLEDVFIAPEQQISCSYQDVTSVGGNPVPPQLRATMLDGLSVNLRAEIRVRDFFDFTRIQVFRIGPDLGVEEVTSGFSGLSFSDPDANGIRRVFGTIHYVRLDYIRESSIDPVNKTLRVNDKPLQSKRDMTLRSMYAVVLPGPNGVMVTVNLGFPRIVECPIVRSMRT